MSKVNIYVDSRRKYDDDSLKSITITLPESLVIELANYGVKSGRGGGKMSGYLEASASIVLGLFNNPEVAKESLLKLIKYNPETEGQIRLLIENMEDTLSRLNELVE